MKVGFLGALDKGSGCMVSNDLKMQKHFSLSYDPDTLRLYSSAKITIGDQSFFTDKALWDTGSTIVAICHSIGNQVLSLPDDYGTSISATDRSDSDIYMSTLELPGGIILRDIEVWDVDLADHGAEVVIGMNVISRGRLVVETIDGTPTFSFSVSE